MYKARRQQRIFELHSKLIETSGEGALLYSEWWSRRRCQKAASYTKMIERRFDELGEQIKDLRRTILASSSELDAE